jgi:hypothetical protein
MGAKTQVESTIASRNRGQCLPTIRSHISVNDDMIHATLLIDITCYGSDDHRTLFNMFPSTRPNLA